MRPIEDSYVVPGARLIAGEYPERLTIRDMALVNKVVLETFTRRPRNEIETSR